MRLKRSSSHILKLQKQKHPRIHPLHNSPRQRPNYRKDPRCLLHQMSRRSRSLNSLNPHRREIRTIEMIPAMVQRIQCHYIGSETHIHAAHRHRLACLLVPEMRWQSLLIMNESMGWIRDTAALERKGLMAARRRRWTTWSSVPKPELESPNWSR